MAETTDIAWADMTWNPWIGCQHAELPDGSPHPGCRNCYARAGWGQGSRTNRAKWGPSGTRSRTSDTNWRKPLVWDKQAASTYDKEQAAYVGGDRKEKPCRPRVFCGSLCDVFENWQGRIKSHRGHDLWVQRELENAGYREDTGEQDFACGRRPITISDLRCDVFGLIDQTPNLTWLLLTKRPQNVREMWARPKFVDAKNVFDIDCEQRSNIWFGVSVSDQHSADQLVPELQKLRDLTPIRFISLEPMLEPVQLDFTDISWVICGAESGPQRRRFDWRWAASLASECAIMGVPFFMKQGSAFKPGQQGDTPDELWNVKEFPTQGET